ncbi:HDOD domain-containing protein [Simiduia sp. 21SJ11W-1]|uniref:HDOD domain-containing protein n=1 Tax=Simiduia sp. 21SJ11W-1 TaxID=2909669 RepID=UPI00209FC903|nr:HDOD domain-containing protein [Simiduia sp. 21SJ11W-1]UTA48954.1 HDOD domain-containing protein [Simiduia sp. 21SJ11W-1]
MPANNPEFAIYSNVIQQVMKGEEQLPSLPAITLRIRKALANPLTSHNQLANLLMQDPSLAALIMKTANSAIYKTVAQAKTLNDAVRLLGREIIDQIVMSHSVKSLFVMKSAGLKRLFILSWQRQAVKTAICILLTQATQFKPTFQPVTGCFLSEIGTLAVLSAFNDKPMEPTQEDYIALCKSYSKSLGLILIKKWQLDEVYIDMIRNAGNWSMPQAPSISALEIINLALYHSLVIFSHADDLPPLRALPAFQNLPQKYQQLDDFGLLQLISKHEDAIAEYIDTLR